MTSAYKKHVFMVHDDGSPSDAPGLDMFLSRCSLHMLGPKVRVIWMLGALALAVTPVCLQFSGL